jgi:hypothetical protein
MPGVVKVVVKNNFVGVVATKPWQAMQAAAALKASWTAGAGLPPQRGFYDHLRRQPARDAFIVNSKDVDDTLAKAPTVVKATYVHPYQMHGSMGHVVRGRRRAGRQGDGLVVDAVCVPDAQRRGEAARGACRQRARRLHARAPAATASTAPTRWRTTRRCCRRPSESRSASSCRARTKWRWENYGFAYAIDQRAGPRAPTGTIVAVGSRRRGSLARAGPGYETPGNVVTACWPGSTRRPFPSRAGGRAAGRVWERRQRRSVVCIGPG